MTSGLSEDDFKPGGGNRGANSKALPFTTFSELGGQPTRKLWIIKNVIARDEVSSFFGPPGGGKSALGADIAIVAASPAPKWRGYRNKGPCGVVYFGLERADLVRRRLQAHKLRDGLTDLPIAVVGKVIDLLNRNCVDIIVDTIRAAEDRFSCEVGLGLFDTFAKGIAAGGGDEDKARDQNIVHANMRRVFDRGCHIHILGIGHTGKDETKGERGSNARRADVDLQVQLTGDLVKVATVIKGNDQPEGLLTSFRLEPFDFGPDEDGDLFQTFIVSPEVVGATERSRQKTSDKQKRALEALIEVTLAQGREPPAELGLPRDVKAVSAQAWMEELLRANVLDQKAKNPSARFGELRTSLAARYMIGTRDDLVWLARPPSPYARPARASGATASNSGSERIAPITLEERDALKRRGFSDDELFDLSTRPQYARDILADENRTPDTERFRVVGEVMKNTPCLVCGGSNNGVKLIKDTRQGGKPMPLHPRCAPDWYENKDPPL